jgi:hypothetical protein
MDPSLPLPKESKSGGEVWIADISIAAVPRKRRAEWQDAL